MSLLRLLRIPALACLATLLLPAIAAAQTSVVVLEFGGGREGAQARRAVVAGLEGAYTLVPLDDVEEAARSGGLDLATPEGAGRAAESAGAALVVGGGLTGQGRRVRTTLVVRDIEGHELATRETGAPFGRPAQRALGEAALELVREAEAALARLRSAQRGPAPDAGSDAAIAPTVDAEPTTDTDAATGDDGDTVPGAVPFFRALVGVDLRTRVAEIATADRGSRGYDGGLYPEAMVALELRPLARAGGIASGLVLGLEGAHSVGLSSEVIGGSGTLSSSSLRAAGQVAWLFATRDAVFAAGPVLGGGYDAFTLAENAVFASSGYGYARAGVAARLAIAGDALSLAVAAGYRLVFGVGELATAFGADGSAWGFDARAELAGALGFGLSWAARFGYERYGLSFEGGAGTLGEGVDGSDAALRTQLLVGWQLP
jgi:hypothetical protein